MLAIESQGKRDDDKPGAWAYYLSYLHAKYRRPPVLTVLCADRATAAWAAQAVTIGEPLWPSLTIRPMVLGPHNFPEITDPEEAARDIPLAVLSTLTHRKSPAVDAILGALFTALQGIDADPAAVYSEYVEAGLGNTPAGKQWRKLVKTLAPFFRSEAAQTVRAERDARNILTVLRAREIDVPESLRERILACTDMEQLDIWLQRAARATNAESLFSND